MNKKVFVDAIKTVVLEGSLNSVETVLEDPPGRLPSPKLVEMSTWYKSLKSGEKEMALQVIRKSIETSLFAFFCVLDGVSTIEGLGEKGVLKLYFEKDDDLVLLNGNDDDYLHNLL